MRRVVPALARGREMWSGNPPVFAREAARVREKYKMAERVGFEPTCRLPDKTLSRRPRYDHFGTSPFAVVSKFNL